MASDVGVWMSALLYELSLVCRFVANPGKIKVGRGRAHTSLPRKHVNSSSAKESRDDSGARRFVR